uniref:Uncharacterized protein n=1 Tax=Nicotiana tabacum TaxID=4097 RepID=A0A1S4B5U6_TOBAC|nr:PREDICTED: uncharacterized protein LOC107804753 [Nicotiana tabacum]
MSLNGKKKIQNLEEIDITNNTEDGREETNKAHAEYIIWLNTQDSFLSQKANIQWFDKCDRNTQFFHRKLREKRIRLQLNRIKNHKGNWVQGDEQIAKAAIRYFNSNFNLRTPTLDLSIMNCISTKITQEDRDNLDIEPYVDEIRHAVFSLSATSTARPDGDNRTFFHTCWDIIRDDINDFV